MHTKWVGNKTLSPRPWHTASLCGSTMQRPQLPALMYGPSYHTHSNATPIARTPGATADSPRPMQHQLCCLPGATHTGWSVPRTVPQRRPTRSSPSWCTRHGHPIDLPSHPVLPTTT